MRRSYSDENIATTTNSPATVTPSAAAAGNNAARLHVKFKQSSKEEDEDKPGPLPSSQHPLTSSFRRYSSRVANSTPTCLPKRNSYDANLNQVHHLPHPHPMRRVMSSVEFHENVVSNSTAFVERIEHDKEQFVTNKFEVSSFLTRHMSRH